jgi:hypothetical protein
MQASTHALTALRPILLNTQDRNIIADKVYVDEKLKNEQNSQIASKVRSCK